MRKDVAKKAREILEKEPYSRINDGYLIRRVVEELEPELYKKDFRRVMDSIQFTGISVESITRVRRNFLEKNPELKVEKTEKARRLEEEKYFLEYSNYCHIPRID